MTPKTDKISGKLIKELYYYTFAVLTPAAGQTQQTTINIDADADFILCDIFGEAINGVTPYTCLIEYKDDSSSKTFQNRPTYSKLIWSNAQSINPQPVYRLIKAKSTITMIVSNNTAVALNVYSALRGWKVTPGKYTMIPPEAGM